MMTNGDERTQKPDPEVVPIAERRPPVPSAALGQGGAQRIVPLNWRHSGTVAQCDPWESTERSAAGQRSGERPSQAQPWGREGHSSFHVPADTTRDEDAPNKLPILQPPLEISSNPW